MNYELLTHDCKWEEIPKEINPAFYKTLFYKEDRPKWYAIMIYKVSEYSNKTTGNSGYVVSDVSCDVPDVLRLGVFWTKENAILFAEAYMKRNDIIEIAKRCL